MPHVMMTMVTLYVNVSWVTQAFSVKQVLPFNHYLINYPIVLVPLSFYTWINYLNSLQFSEDVSPTRVNTGVPVWMKNLPVLLAYALPAIAPTTGLESIVKLARMKFTGINTKSTQSTSL